MAPNSEDFNADEMVAPQWMNEEFFAQILRESENNSTIELKNLAISPASAKGDHYASIIFRAAVNYVQNGEEKQKSLILKTMPEAEGQKKELLSETPIFKTEIGMYTEIIPKFEKILSDAGDETILGGRCLYHSMSPRQLMVFEDLCPQGYEVLRDRKLTTDEAKMAILKLAKFHAVSHKLAKENPQLLQSYNQGCIDVPNFAESDLCKLGINFFLELLDELPQFSKYKSYFEPLQSSIIDLCRQNFREYWENPQENMYYVLCHGDFHYKNMMFKHESGTEKVEDVMLLDFQLCYMGPIVNDLIYASYMLMDSDMRLEHFDELMFYYFENFTETLKRVGYQGPMPKLVDFRKQFIRSKYWELFLVVTFLPFINGFRDGYKDIDKMMDSNDYRRSLYRLPRYIKDLETLLPRFLHLGFFENLNLKGV